MVVLNNQRGERYMGKSRSDLPTVNRHGEVGKMVTDRSGRGLREKAGLLVPAFSPVAALKGGELRS